jgi:hypothetical protein
MYQGVSPWVDAAQWLRTNSGQRPGGTSGAYNRSLCRSAPVLSRYPGAGAAHLTDVPDIPVGSVLRRLARAGAAGWPCSCLRAGRISTSGPRARTMCGRAMAEVCVGETETVGAYRDSGVSLQVARIARNALRWPDGRSLGVGSVALTSGRPAVYLAWTAR